MAQQRLGTINLGAQNGYAALHARLARGAQAVQVRTADETRPRAQRQRLYDVRAASDSAVEEHLHVATDRVGYLGQDLDGGGQSVPLAAAMIGHHDGID